MRKLTADVSAEYAVALEQALLGLEHPAISAVSRFENGPVLWRVEAYALDDTATAPVDAVVAELNLAAQASWHAIADTNWVRYVEKMLPPVAAGRFLVHGPHDRDKAAGHPHAIEIEAGEAFGTAHHGSTEGCLIALSHVVPELRPARVLDLGTGSGVLAIAIARLAPEAKILASDIDARSVEIAAENAGKNGVPGQIRAIVATGLDHPLLGAPASFDLIAANILAGPLVDLAPAIARALKPGGRIVLSGLLDRQAGEVVHAYAAAGCAEINRVTRGEWVTLLIAPGQG
jgi:ribosomal protein L11 methyltransferase